MARQIDRAVDVDRQVGVDLDDARELALVPVVGAPRLARDVFDGEAFVGRQLDVLLRPGAAFVDRRVEHLLQPVARDDELLAEGFVAIDQRFGPGEAALELRGQLLEVRLRKDGRRRVVETARLLLERQTLAAEHPDPDEERRELTIEILTPQAVEPASAVGVVAPGLSDPGTAASDLRTSAARRPISASVQALFSAVARQSAGP